eukprot:gi/632935799/ref/XP_007891342.1/ PREDICTED: uncharacterized protein LOC103178419 [Callorhinchus milii]
MTYISTKPLFQNNILLLLNCSLTSCSIQPLNIPLILVQFSAMWEGEKIIAKCLLYAFFKNEIPEDALLSDTMFDLLSVCDIHVEKSKFEAILTWMMTDESSDDDEEVGVEDGDRVKDEDDEDRVEDEDDEDRVEDEDDEDRVEDEDDEEASDEDKMTEGDEEEDGSSDSEDHSSTDTANADCEIPADPSANIEEDGIGETTGNQCDNNTSDVQSSEGSCRMDQESGEAEQGSVASRLPFENADLEVEKEFNFRSLSSATESTNVDFTDPDSDVDGRKRRKKQKVFQKLTPIEQPESFRKCLFQLLMEIFNGEEFCAKLIRSGIKFEFILKFLDAWFYRKLCHKFNKDRMIHYIDSLRENLWPNGKPAKPLPKRTTEEKLKNKEKAELVVSTFKAPLPKEDMKTFLGKFQDAEINKHLLYRVFIFLLFEIDPAGKDAWNNKTLPCLKILNVNMLKKY